MGLAGTLSGSPGDYTPTPYEPNPAQIFGPKIWGWYASSDKLRDFELIDSKVAVWKNRAGLAPDLSQITPSLRPTLVPASFAGRPSVSFDGADYLSSVLPTAIQAGERVNIWLVGQWASGTGYFAVLQNDAASSTFYLAQISTQFRALGNLPGFEQIVGLTRDTNPHIFRYLAQSSTTGKFRVDVTSYNGTETGGLFAPVTRLTVGAIEFGGSFFAGSVFNIAEIIYTLGTVTAEEATAMDTYLERYAI